MGLYDGTRPEDLRHEHGHELAVMVQELERTVDKVSAAQVDARRLLSAAAATTQDGLARYDRAAHRLRSVIVDVKGEFARALELLAEQTHETLSGSASQLSKRAAEVSAAAQQLTASAQRSELAQADLAQATAEWTEYRRKLDAHEIAVTKRIAKFYAGMSFAERMLAVFRRPTMPPLPAGPARPKAHRS